MQMNFQMYPLQEQFNRVEWCGGVVAWWRGGGVVRCGAVWCGVVSCRVVSCRVVWCRGVCRGVWCRVVSCRVVSCGAVRCRAVPYRTVPYRIVSYRIVFSNQILMQFEMWTLSPNRLPFVLFRDACILINGSMVMEC